MDGPSTWQDLLITVPGGRADASGGWVGNTNLPAA